jgi:hypothetical protein
MELGIQLSFVKTSEFRGGGLNPPNPPSEHRCVDLHECADKFTTLLRTMQLLMASDKPTFHYRKHSATKQLWFIYLMQTETISLWTILDVYSPQ